MFLESKSHTFNVVPECFKDDNLTKVNGNQLKIGKFHPLPALLKTPEQMVTKCGVGDDIGDPYPCPKFHYDLSKGFAAPPRSHAYKVTWLFLGIWRRNADAV